MYTVEQIPNRKQKKYRILDVNGSVYLSELSLKKANIIVGDLNELTRLRSIQFGVSENTREDKRDSQESESESRTANEGKRLRTDAEQRYIDQKLEESFEGFRRASEAERRASEAERRASEAQNAAISDVLRGLDELESLTRRDIRQAYLAGKATKVTIRGLEPETIDVNHTTE